MTTTLLIVINVFSALAIIVLALMQQSKGDMGSAFGGGGSQSMFGSRGSANFLSRTTAVVCAIFFISSLSLAYVYTKRSQTNSVVKATTPVEQTADSEVPTIGGTSTEDNDIPVIGQQTEDDVPTLEADASDVIEAVEESVGAIEDIPAVPE